MNIYELSNDLIELVEMLEDDPENEAIKQTIAMLLLDLDDKAEAYVHVIQQLEADAEQAKAAKMKIAKKQAAAEAAAKRMRDALKDAMLLTGRTKIKRPTCTISTGSRWKAFLDKPVEEIPQEFWKVKEPEADMKAVEKWLKEYNPDIAGNNCTTCEWAHLDQVESLTIR